MQEHRRRRAAAPLLVGALVALALSAVFAGPAMASPAWKFNGEELKGTETILGGAQESGLSMWGMTTTCANFLYEVEISNKEGTGEGNVNSLPLFNCYTDTTCTVEAIEAESFPWHAELMSTGGNNYMKVKGVDVWILYGGWFCPVWGWWVHVTGSAGAFVVPNHPFLVTPSSCTSRPEWNAYVCLQRYVTLSVRSDAEVVAPLTLTRDDAAALALVGVPNSPTSAHASILPGRAYTLQFGGTVPLRPRLSLNRTLEGECSTPDVVVALDPVGWTGPPPSAGERPLVAVHPSGPPGEVAVLEVAPRTSKQHGVGAVVAVGAGSRVVAVDPPPSAALGLSRPFTDAGRSSSVPTGLNENATTRWSPMRILSMPLVTIVAVLSSTLSQR